MLVQAKYLWWNGQIVAWEDARVHVTILGWSTLGAVFEGIKAYWSSERQELYALQFADHYNRFLDSMRLQRMTPRWTARELMDASFELLRLNEVRHDAYVRPIAYFGGTTWFSTCSDSPGDVFIWTTPFDSALGSGRTYKACVSSWTRLGDNVMSPRIKCISNYQNSRMALIEANRHGYDYPILLNDRHKVTEGPASCLFLIRKGVAITPAITSGILESVTRRTLLQMCREDLDIPTEEREVDRTELYVADEVFYHHGGQHVAQVGPLPLPKAAKLFMNVISSAFATGMYSAVHHHSGVEAFYVLEGEQCAETPTQGSMLRKGDTLAIATGVPMRLVVTGSTLRRLLAVIVHDAAQPPTMRMQEGTVPPLVACQ